MSSILRRISIKTLNNNHMKDRRALLIHVSVVHFKIKRVKILQGNILVQKYKVLSQRLPTLIFIIKGFQTIVFIFIVISTTLRPICPPAFFKCLSNSGTYTELRTTSFIESTGFACSDSVSHNRVKVLSIPVLLLACSQDWTCNLQMIISFEA